MVELVGKLYAYRLEFFQHKFEVFDGVVVVVSFVLDIVFVANEDVLDGVGFLILLRLWRVARIINGEETKIIPEDPFRFIVPQIKKDLDRIEHYILIYYIQDKTKK